MEAAGIAPAALQSRKFIRLKEVAVMPLPACLHIACTGFRLAGLVACWHELLGECQGDDR